MAIATSTLIAGIGVAASVAGTATAAVGQRKQAQANERALAAQEQAEEVRNNAMQLDATRRRREVIRQANISRSMAVATGENQGAGGDSAIMGATGGISGRSGVTTLGIT